MKRKIDWIQVGSILAIISFFCLFAFNIGRYILTPTPH